MPGRILVALLLVVQLSACQQQAEAVAGRVTWVYDGDTIEVERIGRVRLLGIDCPEMEATDRDRFYLHQLKIKAPVLRNVARQATDLTLRLSRNQIVSLEFDRERTDTYGRILAYVYLADGRLLNQLLIEKGLAAVYRRSEFELKDQFMAAEAKARNHKRGLWKKGK